MQCSEVYLLTRGRADLITAIHANVPMDSVAAAMRSASMPKFLHFQAVMSAIIPSLGDSRVMQVLTAPLGAIAAFIDNQNFVLTARAAAVRHHVAAVRRVA